MLRLYVCLLTGYEKLARELVLKGRGFQPRRNARQAAGFSRCGKSFRAAIPPLSG